MKEIIRKKKFKNCIEKKCVICGRLFLCSTKTGRPTSRGVVIRQKRSKTCSRKCSLVHSKNLQQKSIKEKRDVWKAKQKKKKKLNKNN